MGLPTSKHPSNTDSGLDINLGVSARIVIDEVGGRLVVLAVDVIHMHGETRIRRVGIYPVGGSARSRHQDFSVLSRVGAVSLLASVERDAQFCTDVQLAIDVEIYAGEQRSEESVLVEFRTVGIALGVFVVIILRGACQRQLAAHRLGVGRVRSGLLGGGVEAS